MQSRHPGQRGRGLWARATWLARAHPIDYLMATAESYATIPLVGRHLEPLGGLAALGVWGYRHTPDFVSSMARNMLTPHAAEVRRQQREQTNAVARVALRGIVPANRLNVEWPAPERVAPVLKAAYHQRQYRYRTAVSYGDVPGQVLDVWRRADLTGPAPVLVFVPGGAWVHGSRILQGYALMSHLAEQGWVCLSIDYRVSPRHRWPRHLTDVKTAVAWARANVDRYGGDRDFVAIAGCSAGGHLAALAGLTPDDPGLNTDLPPGADASVDAAVGIYGRYDWEDRSTPERDRFMDFLERIVVKKRHARHAEVFEAASPIARVRPDAPPFLVVHGTADTVVPVAQARAFVEKLRATSRASVGYLELPGAHHGFDLTDGARTGSAAVVIGLFLNEIHRRYARTKAREVI